VNPTEIRISTDHWLTWSPWGLQCKPDAIEALGHEAYDFLLGFEDESSTHVVLATSRRKIRGWFRYSVSDTELFAQGTWVAPSHRLKGMGTILWNHVIRQSCPKLIHVTTISPGGRALMRAVSQEHPSIEIRDHVEFRRPPRSTTTSLTL
jgi:hypothetical protein